MSGYYHNQAAHNPLMVQQNKKNLVLNALACWLLLGCCIPGNKGGGLADYAAGTAAAVVTIAAVQLVGRYGVSAGQSYSPFWESSLRLRKAATVLVVGGIASCALMLPSNRVSNTATVLPQISQQAAPR